MRTFLLTLIFALATCLNQAALAENSGVRKLRESYQSGGRRIGVTTFLPDRPGRFPAVLVLHSAAGTLVGKRDMEEFARALAQRGKAAFLIRYFDRTGTIFAGDRAIDEHTAVWLETVGEGVDFVERHPRVRADRIGMFGFSLGAYMSVAQGSIDRRIDVVSEIAGGVFEGFHPRMRRLPPTLILHGEADRRVPVSEAYEIRRAGQRFGGSTIMKLYPGEPHQLSRAAAADATARSLAFLDRHLGR